MNARSYTLLMLVLCYILNYLDRQVIVVLQEPIKAEFHLSDWQLGLMTGLAFVLLYTALGLPIARLSDRSGHRVRIISAALALWSLATAACGLTVSFAQLLGARLMVGVGEAGCTPPAMSIIADLYPRRERGLAMGLYGLGICIGSMLGLMGGGWIAQRLGWRMAFVAVGLPGLLLASFVWLTVREPARDRAQHHGAPPLLETIRYMLLKPSYRHLIAGGVAASIVSTSIYVWIPPYLSRAYGLSLSQLGLEWGLASGLAGAIGSVGGGWFSDRLARRGLRFAARAPGFALLASAPLYLLALLMPGAWSAIALLGVPLIVNAAWVTVFVTLAQALAVPAARATVAAFGGLVLSISGVGIAPILVGAASDLIHRTIGDPALSLRWALAGVAMFYLWAAVHFHLSSRTVEADAEA